MKHLSHYMNSPTNIALAHEIAERLDDRDSISQFLAFTQTVPHEKLRQLLNKVCAIPDHEIRNSRGALFTFLVGQYNKYNNGRAGY